MTSRREPGWGHLPPSIDTEYVRTYHVCMNITLSIDEGLVKRARVAAKAMGKSLNQLIREYLEEISGTDDRQALVDELNELRAKGDSGGWQFNREELYD